MLDLGHLTKSQTAQTTVFTNQNSWVQYTRPRGISFYMIEVYGAGGSGGGGASGAASGTLGGGGGGGSGGYSRIFIAADALPDTLYVFVGKSGTGGLGGTGGSGGGSGSVSLSTSNSYVCVVLPSTGTPAIGDTILAANAGSPGGGGIVGVAGTAGVGAQNVSLAANCALAAFGNVYVQGGQNGTAGTLTATAAAYVAPFTSALITCAGAGGGGVASSSSVGNGGSIVGTNSDFIAGIQGGVSVTAGNAVNGNLDGYEISKPVLLGYGGAGGGASSVGLGANGGNAAFAAGGGGGGAGATGGGNGGNGGPGRVIIRAF